VDFLKSMRSRIRPARAVRRMRVIAENIANAESTAQRPGGNPYRQDPDVPFRNGSALESQTIAMAKCGRTLEFRTKYEPGHPAADANATSNIPTSIRWSR